MFVIVRVEHAQPNVVGAAGFKEKDAARVQVARDPGEMFVGRRDALVMDPQLIVYDEPFAGLDPIAIGAILRLIRQTNDVLGITSIVVTHDVEEARMLADLIFLIADGKVVAQGTPERIKRDDSPVVKQFMSGLADGPVPFHYPGPSYAEQLQAMAAA